jgi:hypothetical protein
VGDRATPAGLVHAVELVVGLDALHVRPEHPVAVNALVVDQQTASLGLVEQRDRVQLVADRLVDESVAAEIEQDAVLGVVEAHRGEHERIGDVDAGRHEVAVEPGVVLAEHGAGRQPELEPPTGAVLVRTQG